VAEFGSSIVDLFLLVNYDFLEPPLITIIV